MKRSVIVLAVITALGLSSSGAASAPVVPAEVRGAVAAGDEARDLASELGRASTPEVVATAGSVAVPSSPPTASFDDALRAFYRAVGVAPHAASAPRADVARDVAPLISALAEATTLTKQALSKVSAADRAWAAANLNQFETPWTTEAARLARITSQIDVDAMTRAAALITQAAEAIPTGRRAAMASWVDPTGAIEIGSTGSDTFATDRMLVVDLGGNDTHTNSAGAVGAAPGNVFGLPISVTVDLGGDDYYFADTPNQPDNALVVQGAGIGGVGVLVDRWGNDAYVALLLGSYPIPQCAPDVVFGGYPGAFPQRLHVQGTGAFGVGVLADGSGNDYAQAYSFVNTQTDCHFIRSYVHAQGAGLHRGVGAFVDDTGNDYRFIDNHSRLLTAGAQDAIAGTYGQGFGAGGAGVLVDKEGDDYNFANATATWNNANPSKGTFATTFVQGAVAGLTQTFGAPPTAAALAAGIAPATPVPCFDTSAGHGGPGGGLAKLGPCQIAGVGLHVDVLGGDTFEAYAYSGHGNLGNQCFVGSVALVGAQGSAAWGGLGVMANLDVEGRDSFRMSPSAIGSPCPSDHTRAVAAGQGFGGAVKYPIWDDPASSYAAVDAAWLALPVFFGGARLPVPAIGVLVSAGPACPPNLSATSAIDVRDPRVACDPSWDKPTASPDVYESTPRADSATAVAIAESWAQGSGGRPSATLPNYTGAPTLGISGLGVLMDAGGDDVYRSAPFAKGKSAATYAKSIVQGATEGSIGVLADALGDDRYESAPSLGGGAGSITSLHQGDARAGFGEILRPIAGFVDAGGKDVYLPGAGCQSNGGLTTAVIWGTLGCGAQPNTLIVGIDALSGVAL